MLRKTVALSIISALIGAGGAAAAPPEAIRALIDAAGETGEPYQVEAVARAARAVYPDHAEEIDHYTAHLVEILKERLRNTTADEFVVVAAPEEEEAPIIVEDKVGPVELVPGEAPSFLKLGEWAGRATASGVMSSGNSDNKSFGVSAEARREFSYFKHNIRGYADFGMSAGLKNQHRWGAAYQMDYMLGDRSHAFGRAQFDRDLFSGFDYKLFVGGGVGHFIYQRRTFSWKVEGGPGYQYSPIKDDHEVDQHAAVYGATEIRWLIRDGLKFDQDFTATWTEPTTTLLSTSTLSSALTDTISAGLSFRFRHETSPPIGRLKTDTIFRANLTYDF